MKTWGLIPLAAMLLLARPAPAFDKPNIIIISVDALRPDHMSINGYPRATTATLDEVARSGVSFTDFSASVPLTNPSIATLFTSQSPDKTSVNRNGIPLRRGVTTLPGILRAHGYTTAAVVGSWALDGNRSGLARHFDYYDDHGLSFMIELDARTVTRRAQRLFSEKLEEPFLLWVHYSDPHQPHLPKPGHGFRGDGMTQAGRTGDYYDSELFYTDGWINVLLADLEAGGALDNALLVITADHGEGLGENGAYGHGRWLYQTTLSTPLIMAGPDIPSGEYFEAPARIIDVAPTIIAYIGIDPPADMEGRNLIPAMNREAELESPAMYFETYTVAVIDVPGFRTLGRNSSPTAVGLRVRDLKITYYFGRKEWEMYDLTYDPMEEHNLCDPDDPDFRDMAELLYRHYTERNRKGRSMPEVNPGR